MKRPADQAERDKAIYERERNVIVDAGAGTGKTTLLISRILHLIAPADDGRAFPLERIAAITFTRRAAGELKLRLREALLGQCARSDLTPVRRERLVSALAALDNAMISTVHSFADRLLRLRPADARISPDYEIAEDPAALIDATTRWLLDAVDRGVELDAESIETVRTFQAAELRVWSEEQEWTTRLGLDAFIHDLIETRDREISLPELQALDMARVRRDVEELQGIVGRLDSASPGVRRLRQVCDDATALAQATEVGEALRLAVKSSRELSKLRELTLRDDFEGDAAGWAAYKWIKEGERGKGKGKEVRADGPLGPCVIEPLLAWMAQRLVRLRPTILARYESLKRASRVLDQIDLLIELRDLLAENFEARAFYQGLFDHLLVDEFQDTDPLQAEIVMYLCEQGAQASSMEALALQPGRLTIVGDPKQSIYRFRRADIAMYASVCERARRANCCDVRLTVNFRSARSIIDWVNDGFDAVLGADDGGALYDAKNGSVRNVRLVASGEDAGPPGVHVLPFGDAKLLADESRDVEGEALARYLRFIVEEGAVQVVDPRTKQRRPPRYGDIAVITVATQTLHHLTTELDRAAVPHVVRGGTLFMQDPLHQQFLLGLRALADPADGVARCALLRPAFFAVGLDDLVRDRCGLGKSAALEHAESLVANLRGVRHQGSPGEIARRVLEQTGFGRYVAAGVNGAQRLARLYELCLRLDELARETGDDYDAVTAAARTWIDEPPRIEAPLPVDADAVQVITAHQAKGLEWPIVALWDGRARWWTYLPQVAFTVDPVAKQWALKLDGLAYDPSNRGLHKREAELRETERSRVAYVAATRARDLLIIPEAGEPIDRTIAGTLLKATSMRDHIRAERYDRAGHGWWKSECGVSMRPVEPMAADVDARWHEAAARALCDDLRPVAVTTFTRSRDAVIVEGETGLHKVRQGRFGPAFGVAVHRTLQLVLEREKTVEAAVQIAVREGGAGLDAVSVARDAERARATLRDAGLLKAVCRLEYPIAGSLERSALLAGSIDLLVVSPETVSLIDFKTDVPPEADVRVSHASYVAQVRSYGRVLAAGGFVGDRELKYGLLFTADGSLHWV